MAVYQIVPSNGKTMTFLREHASDILTYTGLGLMAASTISAAVGTKHMMEEKEEVDEEPAIVKRVWARSKHFVASTGFFAAGTFCIIKSDGIQKAQNAALTNTIATMTAGTMAYRDRWKKKVGEEEEQKIFLDEKTEEIEEDGKKKKVKTTTIDRAISTERYFDQWCSWRADDHGDMDLDERTIKTVQADLNQILWGEPEHMVLLNRAYDMLGLYIVNDKGQRVDDRSVAGQVGGWILDKNNPTGDNTIVITRKKTTRRLDDGRIVPTWLLSFNIDGNIMKAAQERGLLR